MTYNDYYSAYATRHETTTEIVNRCMNSFRFSSSHTHTHTHTHRFEVRLIRSRSDAHHTDDACIVIIILYIYNNNICEVHCRYGPSDRLVSGGVRRSRVSPTLPPQRTHTTARPALTRKSHHIYYTMYDVRSRFMINRIWVAMVTSA